MSQGALLQAVKDRLQTLFGLGDESIDLMFDGQPPPACGEQFIAVWTGEWRGNSGDGDLDEYFGCAITVTRRATYAPQDRGMTEIWRKATVGLEPILRKIITGDGPQDSLGPLGVHMSYRIITAANVILGSTVNGFKEPLLFLDGGRPTLRTEDWFSATAPNSGKFANAGISQTLAFGRARRLQDLRDNIS